MGTVFSGLTQGAIYALVASGFVLTIIPSGVINFAQGALTIGGGYLGYLWMTKLGLPEVPAIILNIVVGVVLGLLCEVVCVRPLRVLRQRAHFTGASHNELITTVGAATAMAGLAGVIWGFDPLRVPYHGPTTTVSLLGASVDPIEIIVFGLAVVVAVTLHLWFHRTHLGQACLAVSEDSEAATLRGINASMLSLGAWGAAGALGAVAGLAVGPVTYAVPELFNSLALIAFVTLALGGQTSFLGCLGAGFVVGLISSFATRYLGAPYSDISILCLLLVTLALRPQGFGGVVEARRV